MITDEQITQIADKHHEMWGYQTKSQFIAMCREIIALAQQVKSLEFVQDDYGDLVAKSPMGKFHVLNMVLSGFVYNGKSYPTEYEAIEAANEDYQRRVLQCLVHGGV